MKRHAYIAMILILATWLMTGFSVDDEFYNEYNIFLKHRPASQYYFKSPLGLSDMPVDYPADKAVAYNTYRHFVLTKHWSSGLAGSFSHIHNRMLDGVIPLWCHMVFADFGVIVLPVEIYPEGVGVGLFVITFIIFLLTKKFYSKSRMFFKGNFVLMVFCSLYFWGYCVIAWDPTAYDSLSEEKTKNSRSCFLGVVPAFRTYIFTYGRIIN